MENLIPNLMEVNIIILTSNNDQLRDDVGCFSESNFWKAWDNYETLLKIDYKYEMLSLI